MSRSSSSRALSAVVVALVIALAAASCGHTERSGAHRDGVAGREPATGGSFVGGGHPAFGAAGTAGAAAGGSPALDAGLIDAADAAPDAEPPGPESPTAGMTVSLQFLHSGKCAEVFDGATAEGTKLVQMPCVWQPDQHFLLAEAGAGAVRLEVVHSGKCVQASAGDGDEVRLVQESCTDSDLQRWTLVEASGGTFRLESVGHGGSAGVAGGAQDDNATLSVSSGHDGDASALVVRAVAEAPHLDDAPPRCALVYSLPDFAGTQQVVCGEREVELLQPARSLKLGSDLVGIAHEHPGFSGRALVLDSGSTLADLAETETGVAPRALRLWPRRANRWCVRVFAEPAYGGEPHTSCLADPYASYADPELAGEPWQTTAVALWVGDLVGLDTWESGTWRAFESGFTADVGDGFDRSRLRSYVVREASRLITAWPRRGIAVMATQGHLNLCVAWRSAQPFTTDDRDRLLPLVRSVYLDWAASVEGYHGFPTSPSVEIVGVAVSDPAELGWSSDVPVHAGSSCPAACSRPEHLGELEYEFPDCPGEHFDFEYIIADVGYIGRAAAFGYIVDWDYRNSATVNRHEGGHVFAAMNDTHGFAEWELAASVMARKTSIVSPFDQKVVRETWDQHVGWDQ